MELRPIHLPNYIIIGLVIGGVARGAPPSYFVLLIAITAAYGLACQIGFWWWRRRLRQEAARLMPLLDAYHRLTRAPDEEGEVIDGSNYTVFCGHHDGSVATAKVEVAEGRSEVG